MLKVNTKKHLDELVKDRDSWKTNCIRLWKGVAPVLDLISPELPEDQPRAPKLTPVEKAQRAWDWLQQFVKDAGEFAGAHVLSMVRAHYPLVDLSRLERGYLLGILNANRKIRKRTDIGEHFTREIIQSIVFIFLPLGERVHLTNRSITTNP